MTTPVAQIVDAAAYAQAVEDAVKAAAAYYEGGSTPLDDDAYDRLVRASPSGSRLTPTRCCPARRPGRSPAARRWAMCRTRWRC